MFFEEGNAFSPFPCVHGVSALKSSGSEIFHRTEPSEHLDAIHAAHWREDSSLRGRGFRNTTQLPWCLCFVERKWRAYRPGQRSAVKITAFLFLFLENTRQIEINFSSSQEPRYCPTRLHQRVYEYSCCSRYYSVVPGRSVWRENVLLISCRTVNQQRERWELNLHQHTDLIRIHPILWVMWRPRTDYSSSL